MIRPLPLSRNRERGMGVRADCEGGDAMTVLHTDHDVMARDVPGPRARALIARDAAVMSPSLSRPYPFVMASGRGAHVWDVDGVEYLDFTSGIAVTATGHAHPKVVRAV